MNSTSKSGSVAYYTQLSREDYWSRGNHTGYWWGKGAEALGLSGTVDPVILQRLFEGFSDQRNALVQNAGSARRCSGTDVTLSCPKSFSTLWSQASPALREQ